jgi:hypothetical protein
MNEKLIIYNFKNLNKPITLTRSSVNEPIPSEDIIKYGYVDNKKYKFYIFKSNIKLDYYFILSIKINNIYYDFPSNYDIYCKQGAIEDHLIFLSNNAIRIKKITEIL